MSSEPKNVPDPGVAQGADTLVGILHDAAAAGYDAQFIVRDGGEVDCASCDRRVAVGDLVVDFVSRLEGASDVDDEMLVAWVSCTPCGSQGTLTLGYGPNATKADTEVLQEIDITGATPPPAT